MDPVDWVERIPFSETRNYVMRVLENVQIYRSRLEGGPIAGRLTADLTRGGASPAAIGQPPGAVLMSVAAEANPQGDALNVPQGSPRAMEAFEGFEPLHDVVTGTSAGD